MYEQLVVRSVFLRLLCYNAPKFWTIATKGHPERRIWKMHSNQTMPNFIRFWSSLIVLFNYLYCKLILLLEFIQCAQSVPVFTVIFLNFCTKIRLLSRLCIGGTHFHNFTIFRWFCWSVLAFFEHIKDSISRFSIRSSWHSLFWSMEIWNVLIPTGFTFMLRKNFKHEWYSDIEISPICIERKFNVYGNFAAERSSCEVQMDWALIDQQKTSFNCSYRVNCGLVGKKQVQNQD